MMKAHFSRHLGESTGPWHFGPATAQPAYVN